MRPESEDANRRREWIKLRARERIQRRGTNEGMRQAIANSVSPETQRRREIAALTSPMRRKIAQRLDAVADGLRALAHKVAFWGNE